jgi:phage/plasmid-like protein (TIGR03299 family)
MAHGVFEERVLVRRDAAWHRLGTVIPDDEELTASEAFERAGLDFEIIKVPLTADFDGWSIPTDRYAVIREAHTDPKTGVASPPAYLGVVSGDYSILNNMDLARRFDPLSKVWPVETVGALDNGSTMFLTLKVGANEIAGEDVREFFLLSDNRDGSEALRISYVTERVVCRNTLTAALNGATFKLSVPHSGNFERDVAFWTELVPAMKKTREETREVLEALADLKLDEEIVKEIIADVHYIPGPPQKLLAARAADKRKLSKDVKEQITKMEVIYERKRDLRLRRRLETVTLYNALGDEHPKIAGTGYALYNAVVEREDHGGRQGDGNAASALWGSKADRKQKAFDKVVALLP